jgi:hypothetical protein
MRCLEGKLEYTRIEGRGNTSNDVSAWERIYDGYLTKYGLSKHYIELLKVLKKKAELQVNYVLTKDKFSLTLLEIEEQNLNIMLSNNGNGMTIDQTLVHLSKFVGYFLRAKDITTGEYFTLLEEYKRINSMEHGKKNK